MPKPTSADYIRALTGLGYTFKVNEATNIIEVNGEPINDYLTAEIRTKMRDAGYQYVNVMEDTYKAHAYQARYHPIKDYLSGLAWTGQPHIQKLASHFQDKHNVFCRFLRRWLIGACAKVLADGQNFMLVLAGPQDIGKSYFVRWLCPLPKYFIEGAIDTGDKDAWVRLLRYWIWEVGELGATTRKADREALKNFISQITVTVRKSYDQYDTSRQALASLIGTFNPEGWGFLNDPTGNRRFAVVEVTHIDWSYTALDVNQIWAEAYALYQAGEDWRMTPEEKHLQAEINAEHEVESAVEAMFQKYYTVDLNDQSWTSSIEVILHLEGMGLGRHNQRANMMELGIILKKLGVEKKKKKNVWCYRGIVPKLNIGP